MYMYNRIPKTTSYILDSLQYLNICNKQYIILFSNLSDNTCCVM